MNTCVPIKTDKRTESGGWEGVRDGWMEGGKGGEEKERERDV